MIFILSTIAFLIWCYIGILKLRSNGQGAIISMLDGDGATGVAYIMLFICMVFWPVVLALYIKWTFVQSTIGIWISDVLDGFGDWFTKPRFGGK